MFIDMCRHEITATSNNSVPPNISIDAVGKFTLPVVNGFTIAILNFTTFATSDNNFAIAFSALASSTTAPAAFVAFLVDVNRDFNDPFPIYQPTFPLSLLEINDCGESTFEGTGFRCIISGRTPGNSSKFQMSSTFLITGFILNLGQLKTDTPSGTKVIDARFDPLYFGGFLQRLFTNGGIEGRVYDSQGNFKSLWDIPLSMTVNSVGFGVFYNNTAFFASGGVQNGRWSIVSTDLQKVHTNDSGFVNPNIAATSSPNFSQIALETTSLTITFENAVRLSNGNITIYQQNPDNDLLRQTFSAKSHFVTLDPNEIDMKVTVLESTFNQPSSSYYVVIDDDFVRAKKTNEAVGGVPPRFWTLNTRTTTGLIRLSKDATSFFIQLPNSNRSSFVDQLISQISLALPISSSRLSSSPSFQFETNVKPDQLILPITVEETRNTSERGVTNILKCLDVLIRNKWITALAVLDKWEGVDESFGVEWIENEKINYKLATVGIALSILAVVVLWYFLTRKQKEGRKWIVLKLLLILVDFVFDVLFVVYHGMDFPWLHGPSVLFIALPIALNATLAILLPMYEISEKPFSYNKSQKYTLTYIVAFFAAIDLAFFELMDSKLGGWKIFNLKYSPVAEKVIFWGGVILFFIEDMGQWIIQILYKRDALKYDIIPYFTLVTSTLIIASHLIEWIHMVFFEKVDEKFEITEEDFS
ncbi:10983_t:CDS:2 [Acaulospora morrowiae]|uniref:10983_t:CDS:1 n=1 Tax=Acaulospora morrowiae TaxID=94023 RepID=A0A9N9FRW7_9GLOM|nr:10983_t:CDS:2 [Acaulospora morrowiae]